MLGMRWLALMLICFTQASFAECRYDNPSLQEDNMWTLVMPQYPKEALARGESGCVVIGFAKPEGRGEAPRISVLAHSPEQTDVFVQAVLSEAQSWHSTKRDPN